MVVRHTISLSHENNVYAIQKSTELFDGILSKYLNYILSKERIKESNKQNKSLPSDG
jgi:hypothetical protein